MGLRARSARGGLLESPYPHSGHPPIVPAAPSAYQGSGFALQSEAGRRSIRMSRRARTWVKRIAGRLGLALSCGTCLFLLPGAAPATDPAPACFQDGFDLDLCIEATGAMAASANPDWWVSSGARFLSSGGLGMTLQGFLPENDPWRIAYSLQNPVDTDDGYRPQNIFRMATKAAWLVTEEEVYFHIRAINTSESPNRQGHNGVFLFSRYLDSNNLYVAGLRVDGAAVVKKKLAGAYTTLAYQKVYPGA